MPMAVLFTFPRLAPASDILSLPLLVQESRACAGSPLYTWLFLQHAEV